MYTSSRTRNLYRGLLVDMLQYEVEVAGFDVAGLYQKWYTMVDAELRPLVFMGSSRKDLCLFPEDVRRAVGHALRLAQSGGKHPDAKPLTGDSEFAGAGVLEIVEDWQGDTYRAVYTVRFRERVYLLHAFQKKSKQGARTPRHEIDVVKSRLKDARALHELYLREVAGT